MALPRIFTFIALVCFAYGFSYGQVETLPEPDRIIFKNQKQMIGQIIEVNKDWVVIKEGLKTKSIKNKMIASIYYNGEVISFLYGQNEKYRKIPNKAYPKIGVDSIGKELSPELDRIIFKNHSKLDGQILKVSKKYVVIKLGSAPFRVPKNKIASILLDGEVISFYSIKKNYIKKLIEAEGVGTVPGYILVPNKETAKRGFYNVSYASFNFRSGGEFENDEFSFGISNTLGYQFSQFTGLGIGIGYHDDTSLSRGKIVPVFAEYRGYFSDKKVSTYYSIASGLSFGTTNSESLHSSTSPGSYFYPAIGFKSGSEEASFMIDVGVRFSKVTYTFEDQIFSSGVRTRIEETIFNRNLILRVGVMF